MHFSLLPFRYLVSNPNLNTVCQVLIAFKWQITDGLEKQGALCHLLLMSHRVGRGVGFGANIVKGDRMTVSHPDWWNPSAHLRVMEAFRLMTLLGLVCKTCNLLIGL